MQKKIFTLLIFLFLSSCGYEAIYSKKNSTDYNFFISELNFVGDRDINLKMEKKLNNYKLKKNDGIGTLAVHGHGGSNKSKNFALKVSSISTKIISAKNTAGDATSFKNTIATNIEVSLNGESKNSFVIVESFSYNNNSNKFNLKRYEKEIKNNLAETITEKLIFRLSNIQ